MHSYNDLTKQQKQLVNRLYEYDETIAYATMGSGKTVCYLTAISELLADGVVNRALIIAPLKPCQHVWSQEHLKWDHLCHLNIGLAVGTEKDRINAIESDAKIVVINIENLVWMMERYSGFHNFDAMCIDELSKFSEPNNKIVRKTRRRLHTLKHRVGMTGTPVHEGFHKIFGQALMIDSGKRLGTSKRRFMETYFIMDYMGYNMTQKLDTPKIILSKLKDLLYAMPDYTSDLPPLHSITVDVELPEHAAKQYKFLKDNFGLTFKGEEGEEVEIVAFNAATLSGKLEQYANGFLYERDDVRETLTTIHRMHYAKEEAFKRLLTEKIKGEPVAIFYQFQADLEAIKRCLDELGIKHESIRSTQAIKKFTEGTIQAVLMHPKSGGHGLNLQLGGARMIICYSPIWSNDEHKQLIARLWRRGAKKDVYFYELVSKNTIDELKQQRIVDKEENDKALRAHIVS